MRELNGQDLHYEAKSALADAKFSPRKIALVYILVALLSSLVLDLLSYYITGVVDGMTQLNDLTRRNGLSSMVTTLSLLLGIFTTFWGCSYTAFVLRVSRREDFSYDTLWEGFRLWKRVIGALFFPGLRYLGISIAYILVTFTLGLFSPFLLILCSVAYVVLIVYFAYRYWAVRFLAMDDTAVPTSALCAISSRMMEGRKWQVFKVELHFWWYYIGVALVQLVPATFVLYADSFPVYLVLVLLQVVALFLLHMWKLNEVNVTFAMAYNVLSKEDMPDSQPQGPWSNYLPGNTEQ